MPSFINVVVRGPTSLNYLLSANEQLIIKIYANNGLKNIVYNPQSQEPFSCGSTILPFTCEFRNGYSSIAPTDSNYFLDWDQVIFFLPSTAASNAFHLIIPDIFVSAGITFRYQVAIGAYDKVLRTERFVYHQVELAVTPNGITTPWTIFLVTNLDLTLVGAAGQEVSGIRIRI